MLPISQPYMTKMAEEQAARNDLALPQLACPRCGAKRMVEAVQDGDGTFKKLKYLSGPTFVSMGRNNVQKCRCAACSHAWHLTPPPPGAAPAAPAAAAADPAVALAAANGADEGVDGAVALIGLGGGTTWMPRLHTAVLDARENCCTYALEDHALMAGMAAEVRSLLALLEEVLKKMAEVAGRGGGAGRPQTQRR